jgi:hypothetical protein
MDEGRGVVVRREVERSLLLSNGYEGHSLQHKELEVRSERYAVEECEST